MKDFDKNKEWSYIQSWDINNLYSWAVLQKLPVNNFEWIKDTSQFNEDFKKTIMKKVMFSILKNYMNFIMIYYFYLKECRLKKSKSLQLIYMIAINMLYT